MECDSQKLKSGRCLGRFLLPSEAFAAKYRSSLGGTEGQGSFFSAARADSNRLLFCKVTGCSVGRCALLLAGLAPFGKICELFIVEEKLLSCGKNKIAAAVHALQHSVLEFHWVPLSAPNRKALQP